MSLQCEKRECEDDGVIAKKVIKVSDSTADADDSTGNIARRGLNTENVEKISKCNDDRLSEVAMYITEYLGEHEGFKGVIKQRYSDFLVAELDPSGNTVKLDNDSIPEEEEIKLPAIETMMNEETISNLKKLDANAEAPAVIIEVEALSKEHRRIIHELVRRWYGNAESNTEDRDGKKVIVVTRSKEGSGWKNPKMKYQRSRQCWPPSRSSYTHFTLYKENIDTLQAINLVSKFIGMKPGAFTYAGVKDKRAKTLQRVSVYRTEASKLLSLNKQLRNIMIGNVEYKKEPLKLGDLSGNRFQVVLRNVEGSMETIEKALNSLSVTGCINYYGMQRFGTTVVPTHAIGLVLLKGDWKLAVDLILRPRHGDDDNTTQCREVWQETHDASKALASLRNKNTPEGLLLKGLQVHGMKDLVNALNFIPRNMRLMYIHSYQSYIWNGIVSKRIKKYGLSVVEGDLMVQDESQLKNASDSSESDGKAKITPTVLENGIACSIQDVVLPLVGYNVKLPNNEIAGWYHELLSEDGLDIDSLRHKVKMYSLSGSYRRITVLPKDVRWSTERYEDPTIPLVFSDYDKLKGKTPTEIPEQNGGGTHLAIKLELSLPSSSYATMALREVLRMDTSAAFQSSLNQA